MAKKKNQHLVPKVYLKGFSNLQTHYGKNEYSIFVTPKENINESKKKGLEHSIFTESYFYNLDGENKNNPIIENQLSQIENYYLKAVKKIQDSDFSNDDILYISNFVQLQLQRVESWMSNFQNPFNQIEKIFNDFGGEIDTKEITKKMLRYYTSGNMYKPNIVFEQGIIFIENKSDIPFVTSDNPVIHKMFHIDEIKGIFDKNQEVEYNDEFLKSEPTAFLFFPLNERFALIATKLLKSNNSKVYSINSLETIIKLNLFSYQNAYKNIYSSLENPFKNYEVIIQNINNQYKNVGFWMQLYTQDNRYTLKLKNYIGKIDLIELYFLSFEDMDKIINDDNLKELIIYENDREILHMKDIKMGEIDNVSNKIKIESKLKFGIKYD
ncbi:DUF4238 domain-containing protein [Aliarcobacter sp. ERUVET-7]|uniref:DUF4238 domain-containing protein n=1 Tax=Aliarcobacter sp. ERUVET-7 TaxID=3429683 RepID=UPI003D6AED93